MAEATEQHRDKAEELLGEEGYEPTLWAIASALAEAEEAAVFDFLNWLAPLGYEVKPEHESGPGLTPGELWERWKMERHS